MTEQSTKIESITISSFFENAVPDGEYIPESATYPQSMIDAATDRVVEQIQALYPETIVASTRRQTVPGVCVVEITSDDAEIKARGIRFLHDSPYEADAVLREEIESDVNDAWESALSDPAIIATPLAK